MRNRWTWFPAAAAATAAFTGVAWYQSAGGTPLRAGPSKLVVYQKWIGGAFYTEGSRSYLSVNAKAGGRDRVGYFITHPNDPVYTKRLAAGTYRLDSWQRPCDGNCSLLDPATDRCHRTITLAPQTTAVYTIELTPGHGCRIVAGGP